MKKLFVLLVLFIAALSACQKTSNSSTHPTTYQVAGITNMVLRGDSNSTLDLFYNVIYVGPIQETVTLSLSGLPPKVIVDTTVQNVTTGIPSFNAAFRLLNTDTMAKGEYTIKLICKGSVTGEKSYTFVLKVLPHTPLPGIPHCDSSLVGNWDTCIDFCDLSGTIFSNTISVDGTVANRIHFSNFQNYGIDVYADLDCTSGTFNIPRQTFAAGASVVYGSGTFSNKFISYNVTDSSVIGVNFCSGSVRRP